MFTLILALALVLTPAETGALVDDAFAQTESTLQARGQVADALLRQHAILAQTADSFDEYRERTLALYAPHLAMTFPLTAVVGAPDPAPEDMTPTLEDAPGMVSVLVQAIQDKNWQLVVAMAIMLLIIIVNAVLIKFNVLGDELRKTALPWIAAGTGCLVMFASTLIAGGSWWTAVLAGLVTGTAATGLWELVFKRIRKSSAPKPKGTIRGGGDV